MNLQHSKVLKHFRALSVSHKEPIFIIGIMERSGTNFLCDLLKLDPDCAHVHSPIAEDHLLKRADLLIKYADFLQGLWKIHGKVDKSLMDLFY